MMDITLYCAKFLIQREILTKVTLALNSEKYWMLVVKATSLGLVLNKNIHFSVIVVGLLVGHKKDIQNPKDLFTVALAQKLLLEEK